MRPFPEISGKQAAKIRRKLKISQKDFWAAIGVAQSNSSRYESGREISKPARELLRLVHIEGIPLEEINGVDFQVANLLRKTQPELFRKLRAAARKAKKRHAKDSKEPIRKVNNAKRDWSVPKRPTRPRLLYAP